MRSLRRLRLAAPLALAVLAADCTSKQLAVEHLVPAERHPVIGDVVQFTLVYNRGAAMGLPVGAHATPILLAAGTAILGILLHLLWQARPEATAQRIALGLILGGALGNYLSRLLSPRGVVDFINVGIGPVRFWVFNVADIGVCLGAILLAHTLWRAEGDRRRPPAAAG